MSYFPSSIKAFASKIDLWSLRLPIFVALLLFGQVFFSTIAHYFGVENRFFILPFRGLIALYSLYVVLTNFVANRTRFIEAFPLSLFVFWFIYFAKLLLDYFFFDAAIALPIWEFFAWGIGGCFLPSLACYFLADNSGRDRYPMSILFLGFLLLGSSAVLFAFSAGFSSFRFQLPSLNPINASHSFFALALVSICCLANRHLSVVKSLFSVAVAAFGVSMGIYAGSRAAMLAFVCSFLIVVFASRFNRLWVLAPLLFSVYLLVQFDPSDLVGRLSALGSDTNSVLRLLAVRESIRVFFAHPFLGAGFSYHLDLSASIGYQQMWYPHNFIFESLGLGGLLLTVPLFNCIFLAIRSCADSLNSSSASQLWRIAILVQALGYVTFSGHLSNVPLFWIALGLATSLPPQATAKISA